MGYERVCRRLLEYGVLAHSIYNSQPWKFSVDGKRGVVHVHASMERARPIQIDENRRDLYLALGGCIENMILAAPALGYEIELTLSLEESALASLRLKPMKEAMPESLFSSLLVQQSHAGLYEENSAHDLHFKRLENVPAFSNREKMYFLHSQDIPSRLIPLLHDLSHEGSANPLLVEEAARWIRTQSNPEDGLTLKYFGLPLSVKARFAFLRYFSGAKEIREVARQILLRQGHGVEAPAFMLVTAKKKDLESYVNAGRWYSRLILTLSEMELGSQALDLPITLTSSHLALLEYFKASDQEEPVFLTRWGRPVPQQWPSTFRRPASECSSLVL